MKLNGRKTTFEEGETILEVAKRNGVGIPTLCHLDSQRPFVSCGVCVVEDSATGKLLAACSTPADDAMDIHTDTIAVKEQRKAAIELLLSEHLGDCEAPCELACPASLDVPRVIRLISSGEVETANDILKRTLAFPKIVSRICSAPCEKACRRSRMDETISIRLIERFAAEHCSGESLGPQVSTSSNSDTSVAVVGAGLSGLACAFHLNRLGFSCEVFEKEAECWGDLANAAETLLPKKILEDELEALRNAGVQIHTEREVELSATSLRGLLAKFAAVVLATGHSASECENSKNPGFLPRGTSAREIMNDSAQPAFSLENVIVIGNAAESPREIVRGVANAKRLAEKLAKSLLERQDDPAGASFTSRFGGILPGDLEEFAKIAADGPGIEPKNSVEGFSEEEAVAESKRCLRCDCAAAEKCRLRELADEFGATGKQTRSRRVGERRKFIRVFDGDIVFEPGKCVKCGRCVRICAEAGENCGPTLINRGYHSETAFPFGTSPKEGLGKAADACAEACPTGAISKRLNPHRENRAEDV